MMKEFHGLLNITLGYELLRELRESFYEDVIFDLKFECCEGLVRWMEKQNTEPAACSLGLWPKEELQVQELQRIPLCVERRERQELVLDMIA